MNEEVYTSKYNITSLTNTAIAEVVHILIPAALVVNIIVILLPLAVLLIASIAL